MMPVCKRCEDNGDLGKVCPHYGPDVHRILADLIAELRDLTAVDDSWARVKAHRMADRAEARLKGLTDE